MLITALYPPSVNSNKPGISESGSDAHFVYKLFFCLLVYLVTFVWKLNMMCEVKGTEANRSLVKFW